MPLQGITNGVLADVLAAVKEHAEVQRTMQVAGPILMWRQHKFNLGGGWGGSKPWTSYLDCWRSRGAQEP